MMGLSDLPAVGLKPLVMNAVERPLWSPLVSCPEGGVLSAVDRRSATGFAYPVALNTK